MLGKSYFFQFRKSLDFGSGRHESLAFTIWREISRSLKEFLFMQPSIGSFDMVIFTELPEPDSHSLSLSLIIVLHLELLLNYPLKYILSKCRTCVLEGESKGMQIYKGNG